MVANSKIPKLSLRLPFHPFLPFTLSYLPLSTLCLPPLCLPLPHAHSRRDFFSPLSPTGKPQRTPFLFSTPLLSLPLFLFLNSAPPPLRSSILYRTSPSSIVQLVFNPPAHTHTPLSFPFHFPIYPRPLLCIHHHHHTQR